MPTGIDADHVAVPPAAELVRMHCSAASLLPIASKRVVHPAASVSARTRRTGSSSEASMTSVGPRTAFARLSFGADEVDAR